MMPQLGEVWAHESGTWGVLLLRRANTWDLQALVLWDDEDEWAVGAAREIEMDYLTRVAEKIA